MHTFGSHTVALPCLRSCVGSRFVRWLRWLVAVPRLRGPAFAYVLLLAFIVVYAFATLLLRLRWLRWLRVYVPRLPVGYAPTLPTWLVYFRCCVMFVTGSAFAYTFGCTFGVHFTFSYYSLRTVGYTRLVTFTLHTTLLFTRSFIRWLRYVTLHLRSGYHRYRYTVVRVAFTHTFTVTLDFTPRCVRLRLPVRVAVVVYFRLPRLPVCWVCVVAGYVYVLRSRTQFYVFYFFTFV